MAIVPRPIRSGGWGSRISHSRKPYTAADTTMIPRMSRPRIFIVVLGVTNSDLPNRLPVPLRRIPTLAGHMENGIGLLAALIQELHGFFRGEDEQFDFAPLSLTFDLIHDW